MSTFITASDVKGLMERFEDDFDEEVEETRMRYDGTMMFVEVELRDETWSVCATNESSLSKAMKEKYAERKEKKSNSEEEESE